MTVPAGDAGVGALCLGGFFDAEETAFAGRLVAGLLARVVSRLWRAAGAGHGRDG